MLKEFRTIWSELELENIINQGWGKGKGYALRGREGLPRESVKRPLH